MEKREERERGREVREQRAGHSRIEEAAIVSYFHTYTHFLFSLALRGLKKKSPPRTNRLTCRFKPTHIHPHTHIVYTEGLWMDSWRNTISRRCVRVLMSFLFTEKHRTSTELDENKTEFCLNQISIAEPRRCPLLVLKYQSYKWQQHLESWICGLTHRRLKLLRQTGLISE